MPDSSSATYRDPFTANDPRRDQRGRAKGSRAKLAKRFFEDTYAAWEEQGPSVLARAAFHDPVAFANMVARLMPQKIEVSTPTDGMSDERLAELLDLAERMAALKAGTIEHVAGVPLIDATALAPPALNHEKPDRLDAAEEGGGGPLRRMGGGGENTSYALRPQPADRPETVHNPLCSSNFAAAESTQPLIAETPLPHPVGKPFATPDHVVERRNIAGLERADEATIRARVRALTLRDEDIDPASLF